MNKSQLWIIVCFTSLLLLLNGCGNSKSFIVEGEFTVKDPTPVKLYHLQEDKSILIDSVSVAEKTFHLEGPIQYPGIYRLSFFNDQEIYLVLFPGNKIELSIDNLHSNISYYVENSPESKRVKELMDKQNFVLRQIDQLSREWEMHRGDSSYNQNIDSSYYAIMHEHREYSLGFIKDQPNSLANILALSQNFGRRAQALFDRYDDLEIFSYVDSCLVAIYPYSAPVIALNKKVNETKDQIKHKKYIEKVVEAGRPLPPLSVPDINGDTISIDGNLKKPVLVLFWATWNPYSVNELLALNEFIGTPDADKIKIVSISLDSDEEKLSQFIVQNNLAVPVICDYNYWDSDLVGKYAVKQVPSTLLSNKEGVVIAKDIYSEEIYNRIKEVIK